MVAGLAFMRLNVFPSYQFWYYVSLLALFSIAFLVYNYVYQFANYKNGLVRLIWFGGTVIILVISATGYFLAPPEMLTNEQGKAVFKYAMDWRIAIPLTFLCASLRPSSGCSGAYSKKRAQEHPVLWR